MLGFLNELVRASKNGPIETIKAIRAHTNLPLKEAKDLYDQLASNFAALVKRNTSDTKHGWMVTWDETFGGIRSSHHVHFDDDEYPDALETAEQKASEKHVELVRVSRVVLIARVETKLIVELV
jgi:hypothetical protein